MNKAKGSKIELNNSRKDLVVHFDLLTFSKIFSLIPKSGLVNAKLFPFFRHHVQNSFFNVQEISPWTWTFGIVKEIVFVLYKIKLDKIRG
jgi:hypothetical protein